MATEISLSLRQLGLNLEKLKGISSGTSQINQLSENLADTAYQLRKHVNIKTKWKHFEQEIEFYRKQTLDFVEIELPKMNESHSKTKDIRPQQYLNMISIPVQHTQETLVKWLTSVQEALLYQDKKGNDTTRSSSAKARQQKKTAARRNYCSENLQTIEQIVRRLEQLELLIGKGKANEVNTLIRGPPPTAVVQLEDLSKKNFTNETMDKPSSPKLRTPLLETSQMKQEIEDGDFKEPPPPKVISNNCNCTII